MCVREATVLHGALIREQEMAGRVHREFTREGKGKSFESQKAEARVGVRILNRMIELGRPNFERTA
jgi:hypothetical protein